MILLFIPVVFGGLREALDYWMGASQFMSVSREVFSA